MLLPEGIPTKEPQIDVGIVLPEDRYNQIQLETPADARFALRVDDMKAIAIEPASKIDITRNNETLRVAVDGGDAISGRRVEIMPEGALEPKTGYGLLVRNVVAGRNFHWQKHIDVSLPGGVVSEIKNDAVILINRLPFEQYVMCVATSEMSASCPKAFLEAQTITARSWMLANVEKKHRALDMDVCNDDCCQRYQGSTFLSEQAIAATSATAGEVILYNGRICDARYSKSCGGMMEAFENAWPGEPHPYLQVKPDMPETEAANRPDLSAEKPFEKWLTAPPKAYCSPHFIPEDALKKYLGSVDESGRYFRWTVELSQQEMTAVLNQKTELRASAIEALAVLKRGGSGRVVHMRVVFQDQNRQRRSITLDSEYAIRAALHPHFLYSSAIVVESIGDSKKLPASFRIRGAGWGHGVGLCQIGGLGMALAGESASTILAHYYPGSQLQKIY